MAVFFYHSCEGRNTDKELDLIPDLVRDKDEVNPG